MALNSSTSFQTAEELSEVLIFIPGHGEHLEQPFFLSVLYEGPGAKPLEQVSVIIILFLPIPTSGLGAAKTWLCTHYHLSIN